MRRMIFTLNVLLGNIEREGGLYQKKTPLFTINWPEKGRANAGETQH